MQRHAIVHLMILGLVAVQAQGLVGHEFPDTGVDGGSDCGTAMIASEERMREKGDCWSLTPQQRGTYPRTTPDCRSQNINWIELDLLISE